MTNKQADIFDALFGKLTQGISSQEMLLQITKKYPYFSPAHFFLLQQMQKQDDNYKKQAATTNLFFNNPYWLHYQLNKKNIIEDANAPQTKQEASEEKLAEASKQQNESIASTITFAIPTTTEEKLIFEPLFASDYFASQGIKIREEAQPTDKLGKQLKSFTDWLKTMKKVHAEKLASDNENTDTAIQQLAEKSNTDEAILTESMAEVFAKQNKIAKAIEVYEKLSLLNPSKSANFAAKIEKLKRI
jgi:hypothetical protein